MSRPQPRPKRTGEDHARTHLANHIGNDGNDMDGPASSKRPRFDLRNPSALAPDALEDDAVLDADEIGRRGQQVRRNAVNIDGFDSDSENEGFDARAEAKAQANKMKEDASDDMFANSEEDLAQDSVDPGLKRKDKRVHFLKDEEIEGQVSGSRSGRKVDITTPVQGDHQPATVLMDDRAQESDSESEVGDEERATVGEDLDEEIGAGGKKNHAPLLDAFNMRAEQEEGRFDDQGNFVRKAADPDAIHDTWLEGVSKKDIRKAKEAEERRDEERRQRDRADDSITTSDVLKTLIQQLGRGETVLEALARLGKSQTKKPKWQTKGWKNKKKAQQPAETGADDVDMREDDPTDTARKNVIEAITGAADVLLTRGQAEIYDAERELLMRQYRRETGEDWVDPPVFEEATANADAPKMWEYRWSDARDGGETHGPYDGTMMEAWNAAGYFGDGVEFRRAGDDGVWRAEVDFV